MGHRITVVLIYTLTLFARTIRGLEYLSMSYRPNYLLLFFMSNDALVFKHADPTCIVCTFFVFIRALGDYMLE